MKKKEIFNRKVYKRLVEQECANWYGPKSLCYGITVDNNRFRKEGECYIMKGKNCDYFKTCVLPAHKGI